MGQGRNVIDYAVLAVGATVVGLADGTPALPAKANRAFITCETAAVRWRSDGTDPAGNEGHILAADSSITFTEADYRELLETIKFIADTVTEAALKITYFD